MAKVTVKNFNYIKQIIGTEELVVKQGKQSLTLTIKEIQFVLFRMTCKLLENNNAVLSRNYFCGNKKSCKDSYEKYTNRKINTHKFARIVELLDKYNFIILERTFKLNIYSIGLNNPYYSATDNCNKQFYNNYTNSRNNLINQFKNRPKIDFNEKLNKLITGTA